MSITILDLALHRGAKRDENGGVNGGEFNRVGLAIMGGCVGCEASLAAYNAFPSRSGYWCCRSCIGDDGWDDAAEADRDIFGDD